MQINTVRYYLHDLESIDAQIEKLKNEIKEYKNMEVDSITIQIITDMPTCHSVGSKVEKIATTRIDYILKREAKLFEMMILRSKIEEAIEEVKENTAIDYILKNKYLKIGKYGDEKQTLEQMAACSGYSVKTISNEDTKFMKKVLRKVQNI